jgi:isochorismate synthase
MIQVDTSMNTAISYDSGANIPSTSGVWHVFEDDKPFEYTLREAGKRAREQRRPVLASLTYPLPVAWSDPIRVFRAASSAGLGNCFYWEHPIEQFALIGIGAAATIETQGSAYCAEATAAWRALLQYAVVASDPPKGAFAQCDPVLFGGFSFDPLTPRTSLWADFPDGLLILPQMLVSYRGDAISLTLNQMMKPADDSEERAKEIGVCAQKLLAAVEAVESEAEAQPQANKNELPSRDVLPASEWMDIVARAVERIRSGAFEKVVLARDIQLKRLDTPEAFDISATLQRLRESYPTAYVFAVQRWDRYFAGATPEQLVRAENGQIRTMALAGSARRGESEAEDRQLGEELLQSAKNNSEHAIVVAMVREAIERHCTDVQVSAAPELLKLKNVQHLMTPITGKLLAGHCMLDLIADLHPTPAVGGFPRQAALEAIRETEKLDRGWYAAPLGWIGTHGDGEFAVALRSGLINGNEATLFAGCGIVAESDPQAEFAESSLKLQVMLRALDG